MQIVPITDTLMGAMLKIILLTTSLELSLAMEVRRTLRGAMALTGLMTQEQRMELYRQGYIIITTADFCY